jgi:CheY-like chemotaxis protein
MVRKVLQKWRPANSAIAIHNMDKETRQLIGPPILPIFASPGLAEAILAANFSHSLATGENEIILLVEDEAFVRTVTSEVLESAGYRVRLAASAAEALERLGEQMPGSEFVDLLLADVVLPGKSGYELSQEFAALCPAGKILLMTGYAEHLAWCHQFVNERLYLAKPFSADTLLRQVRAALDRNSFS